MFNPNETSLFGVTGGGVLGGVLLGILLFVGFEAAASLGEESSDPHRSIPRAVLWTIGAAGAFFVFMAFAFSIGYGKVAVAEGAWAFSPGPVSEMATRYIGSWYATLLELVIILDAMALALAICVLIGRGFFALGRDGLLPASSRKTSRYDTPWVGNLMVAVGCIGLIVLVQATDYASSFGVVGEDGEVRALLPERPVRDVHPVGDDRVVRGRARVPDPRRRRRSGSRSGGGSTSIVAVAVATPILGFYGALNPEPHDGSNYNWVAMYWTLGLIAIALVWFVILLVTRREPGRQRCRARGGAPRRAAAGRDARLPSSAVVAEQQWHDVGPAGDAPEGHLRRVEAGGRASLRRSPRRLVDRVRRHLHARGVLARRGRARRRLSSCARATARSSTCGPATC